MSSTSRKLIQFAVALAFILAGAAALGIMKSRKPQMKKVSSPVRAPSVRTMVIHTAARTIDVMGEGTVSPLREIQLVPQVNGKVEYISPSLIKTGKFSKGETLLRIDNQDYKLAVVLARAKVKNSESQLKRTEEEAAVAREEWSIHHDEGAKGKRKPPPLVAMVPQLEAAKAKLEADRADLKMALLRLARTELKAPFDGRMSQKSVNIGQYVTNGKPVAVLYSTDAAEISLHLEDLELYWLNVPGFTSVDPDGSPAKVYARIAGKDTIWHGSVIRAEGRLDTRTRLISIVVRVNNPFDKLPPLAPGLFVSVEIEGRTISDVAVIPRSALHPDNTVWIVDKENRIVFREVDVAKYIKNSVIIKKGLKEGDVIAVSSLKAVSNGMKVRVSSQKKGERS